MSARFIFKKDIALERFSTLRNLGLRVTYSIKTNPLIVPILEDKTDAEFTMHAMEPLDRVKDKGRIWYYAHAWDEKEIKALLTQGIRKFVVDNETDLTLLESALEERKGAGKQKVQLLLRAKLKEHSVFTGRHYVFGMDANVVNRRINELKDNPGIEKLGVHVHRKSQNVSEWSLKRELTGTLSEETWKAISIINIGGGLPAEYSNSSNAMVRTIFDKIKDFVEFANSNSIEVIVEPGRFIAAPAVVLETTIKRIESGTIIVDASVYNTAMDTLIVPLKLLVDGELESGGKRYTIKGCTPCSMDIFRYAVNLKEPKIGDTITFLNAGAYNFKTEFCDLPRIETVEQ